jgi:hypothetical protein
MKEGEKVERIEKNIERKIGNRNKVDLGLMCTGVRLHAATSSTLVHSSESKRTIAGARDNTQ